MGIYTRIISTVIKSIQDIMRKDVGVDGVGGGDTVGTTGESLWDHSGGGCGNVTGGAPGTSLALAHP